MDTGVDKDFDKVIKDLAKTSGAPSATKMKLQYEEIRIASRQVATTSTVI